MPLPLSGDCIPIDVGTVFHGRRFLKYNFSLLGYGYYGDCILDSEQNRWMGPKRYDWAG
jgi:ceramide kinase